LRSESLVQACEVSLDRLGTDYLDLYLIHWPNDKILIEHTMEGMNNLVADGKIRSVGLSNFNVKLMKEAMSASEQPICNNQVEYHPFRDRREIPQFCKENDITLTACCPLARGKVLKDPTFNEIARKYGKSPAQVSLRWLLQKGAIVIPKSSSREQLRENMDLDGWELVVERSH
jgi:diketogulonate reductase-like aldo/keto reductase